jgi:hypothetical protein
MTDNPSAAIAMRVLCICLEERNGRYPSEMRIASRPRPASAPARRGGCPLCARTPHRPNGDGRRGLRGG